VALGKAHRLAGILADLNQYPGRSRGFFNRALYGIGGDGHFKQIGRDILVGNNAYNGVPGYTAIPCGPQKCDYVQADSHDRISPRRLDAALNIECELSTQKEVFGADRRARPKYELPPAQRLGVQLK
jgi:hypothetical protein